MNSKREEQWNEAVIKPFERLDPITQAVTGESRAVHALEYIAAQLGQLNAKLDRLLSQKESASSQ